MQYNSREVSSAQEAVHPAVEDTVCKHLAHPFRKPIAAHTRAAFVQAQEFVALRGLPVVLDTGCGTGESTLILAAEHSGAAVIGVDKSAHRLAKTARVPDNALLVRADLVDFWRLAAEAGWQVHKQYLLYPNPWPRPEHLMRRWHGHPVFGCILHLGGEVELRTNWRIYAEEFAVACALAAGVTHQVEEYRPVEYTTPFERKYALSGQMLYRYRTVLG